MSLYQRIINGIRARLWRMKLRRLPRGERFELIYQSDRWYSNKESRSGSGSTLEATTSIRHQLPKALDQLGVQSVLDVGCGDFHWMSQVEHSCKYHGVDISPSVIQLNIENFSSNRISFSVLDAVEGPIPKGFDLVLCREVLFHLSNHDSRKLIGNLLKSGAKYFAFTTDQSISANRDIESAEFRNVNMQIPPFNFPTPLRLIEDSGIRQSRAMGIWKCTDLIALSRHART